MQPALSTSNHSHNLILRRAITPLQLIRTNHERHSSNLFGDKVTGDHNLKIYSFEFCKKKKKTRVKQTSLPCTHPRTTEHGSHTFSILDKSGEY